MNGNWREVRDRTRLWCKIDPERCLLEIVHRGIIKYIDLRAYGLTYVGFPEADEQKKNSPQGDDPNNHRKAP
jgi:hypothetical protein